jgi:predicted AAA+ superfamily ATPase
MSMLAAAEGLNPWWRSPAARLPWTQRQRRALQPELARRLSSEPRRALILRGPRQVGKSVILAQCADDLLNSGWPAPNLTYFDFSDDRLLLWPTTLRDIAEHRPPGFDESRPRVLLLDEITRALDWAEWLKQAVDHGGARILGTDSSASLLRYGSSESGVGRWDEITIEGLTYREFLRLLARDGEDDMVVERRLPAAFERYVVLGGFPEHVASDSLTDVWRRLREDIADKAIAKDLRRSGADTERVTHLFQYLLENSGSLVDLRKLARAMSAGGIPADPRSVAKWLELLEQTMLIVTLSRWTRSAAAKLKASAHPMVYAADHALVMAFAPSADPSMDPGARGRAFEAIVYRHLREHALRTRARVSFHRSDGKNEEEIDFVVDRIDGGSVALEVKSSASLTRQQIAETTRRARRIGADRALLVYGGLSVQEDEHAQVVPLRDFVLSTSEWIQK